MIINNYNKEFGAYIVINTTECALWTRDDVTPLIQSVTSAEEFNSLGFRIEEDGYPFNTLKVGESVSIDSDAKFDIDYEGVYVMRVG